MSERGNEVIHERKLTIPTVVTYLPRASVDNGITTPPLSAGMSRLVFDHQSARTPPVREVNKRDEIQRGRSFECILDDLEGMEETKERA